MKLLRALGLLVFAATLLESCGTSGARGPKNPTDDDPRTLVQLANSSLAAGQHADAIRLYEQAIAKDPTQSLAHNNLGLCHLQLQALDKAEAAFRKALEINATYCDANNNLGTVLKLKGDREGARQQWTTAIDCPGYSTPHTALFNLGVLQMEERDYEGAVKNLRAAWERRPDFMPAGMALGTALREGGRLREACAQFEACAKAFPQNCDALYEHGKCLYDTKSPEPAAAAFDKVIQTCPGTDPARKANEYLRLLRER